MGRRQRHTEFINLTAADIQALIDDPNTPPDIRKKAIAEQKFAGDRNKRKERKRRK
jgi:hypothetical protein